MHDPEAFGQALQAHIPVNWPPELLTDALPWFHQQLSTTPQLSGWLCWYGVCEQGEEAGAILVASGGFLGMSVEGTVEIGYSVLPQFQAKGYATEMVSALVHWVLAQPEVQRVVAEANAENKASLRVLAKVGFVPVGAGREPQHLRFERTARD